MSRLATQLYIKLQGREMRYQMVSLLVIFVLVHALYEVWIRPVAGHTLQLIAESKTAESTDENASSQEMTPPLPGRIAVVLKDYEQEVCMVAMFWAFGIMLFKFGALRHARMLFQLKGRKGHGNFLETVPTDIILPETKDWDQYQERLDDVKNLGFGTTTLYKISSSCIDRFFTTGHVPEAAIAAQQVSEIEAERQESGLSIVRYLIWFIPSLGFIGTVRGIGAALGQAEEAVQGNIGPVTESLGVAFNSTLVALVISVFVMFFLHRLQEAQEALVLDAQEFCNQNLLRCMRGKGSS